MTEEVLPYLAYSLIIIFGVYILPGMALVPRVIFDSRLAYAVPIMSVLVAIGLARAAKFLGVFTQAFAIIATLALAAIACYRLWHLRQTQPHWPTMHRLIYLTSIFLMLPAAAVSSTAVFMGHDVVAAWNPWAIQHMQGLPFDQSFTHGSSYPQNYPYLLAWCFHLLGSTNLQLPVKSGFAMLGISFVAAIGMVGQHRDTNNLRTFLAFIVLAVVLLYVGGRGLGHTFALYNISYHDWRYWWGGSLSGAYATILLVPPIVVSIALYLQYQRSVESPPHYIWLAAGAAVVAGLARQEAYPWLMGVFPLLIAWNAYKRKQWNILYPAAIAWCIGLLWLMTEGSSPINKTTMPAAFGERSDWFEQLQYMFDHYILNEPVRAVVFSACIVAVLLYRCGLDVFVIYLIPAFLVWTYLGAYSPRHGLHISAIAILLIVANSFGWVPLGKYAGATVPNQVRYLVCIIAISAVIYAGFLFRETISIYGPQSSLLDARRNLTHRIFNEHAEFVYHKIFLKRVTIWAPSSYAQGMFYGNNPNVFFQKDTLMFAREEFKNKIERTMPDYLLFEKVGRHADYLDPFIKACSAWFEPIAIPLKSYRYNIYRINREAIKYTECSS